MVAILIANCWISNFLAMKYNKIVLPRWVNRINIWLREGNSLGWIPFIYPINASPGLHVMPYGRKYWIKWESLFGHESVVQSSNVGNICSMAIKMIGILIPMKVNMFLLLYIVLNMVSYAPSMILPYLDFFKIYVIANDMPKLIINSNKG